MTLEKTRSGSASGDSHEDFTGPAGYSYLTGVFVAINAIPDAYLLVDGPDCVHMKTQYIQGNHDWLSLLTDVSGFHRVANSALHPTHMARSREDRIRALMQRLAAHPASGVVLVTAMPMAAVTAVDYERLAADIAESQTTPILQLPGHSLSGDWLDGYAQTLNTLARHLPLEGTPRSGAVAVVGHLLDRKEEDCLGNVRELTRLLASIALDPVSIWLDGSPVSSLARAAEAELIISLPYGRRAARALAQRTGAALLETELPFGVDSTERWLRAVAAASGRPCDVDSIIHAELSEFAQKLEWVVPSLFENRRIAYIGDPHLLSGLAELAPLLGLNIALAVVSNRARHARDLIVRHPTLPVLVAPTRETLSNRVTETIRSQALDLLVGNGLALDFEGVEVMGFGFPNELAHALYDRPFLGFRGALSFCDSLANHMRRVDRSLWGALYHQRGPLVRPPG